jgi:hypothetical protein
MNTKLQVPQNLPKRSPYFIPFSISFFSEIFTKKNLAKADFFGVFSIKEKFECLKTLEQQGV